MGVGKSHSAKPSVRNSANLHTHMCTLLYAHNIHVQLMHHIMVVSFQAFVHGWQKRLPNARTPLEQMYSNILHTNMWICTHELMNYTHMHT